MTERIYNNVIKKPNLAIKSRTKTCTECNQHLPNIILILRGPRRTCIGVSDITRHTLTSSFIIHKVFLEMLSNPKIGMLSD